MNLNSSGPGLLSSRTGERAGRTRWELEQSIIGLEYLGGKHLSPKNTMFFLTTVS